MLVRAIFICAGKLNFDLPSDYGQPRAKAPTIVLTTADCRNHSFRPYQEKDFVLKNAIASDRDPLLCE